MNRWRQRLAELRSSDVSEKLSAPSSAVQNVQIVQKPEAPPGCEHFEQIEHPTGSTAMSDRSPAIDRARIVWSNAEEEPAATSTHGLIPRTGLPEIPDVPVLLRDGRRMWRFSRGEDCGPDQAAALINEARWCGAVVAADGREQLIVVERWMSGLPVETLLELRRCAGGVIAALHRGCD
jgi:hypothetical protein